MSGNPISSVSNAIYTPPIKQPEAAESTVAGKDVKNDGDADDRGASAASATPATPSVNANGQVVGTTVNTQA